MSGGAGELVVAVDEAGYGPNLGPLVIAATAWRNRRSLPLTAWRAALEPGFCFEPTSAGPPRLAIGDSKKWIGRGRPMEHVRRTLEYFASRFGGAFGERDTFFDSLDESFLSTRTAAAWLCAAATASDAPEPARANDGQDTFSVFNDADRALRDCGLEPVGWAARIVGEAEFNEAVLRAGNKASVLSRFSLELADRLMRRCRSGTDSTAVRLIFDKHGGRNKYLPLLLEQWPERFFEVHAEGLAVSRYRSATPPPWEVEFAAKADSLPPVGLSSMLAKWTREVLMLRLNAYWSGHCPGVRPTAGYPLDAKRFAAEIAAKAEELGLERQSWWRNV